MPPDVHAMLLAILKPALRRRHTNCRPPIPPDARLDLTLRYLALGDSFTTLSQGFRVGLSTARIIVKDTCQAIVNLMMEEYIKTPQTEAEWLKVARGFEQRWNCPHVLGCLDGKHVRIVPPPRTGSLFYNYKDFFSIVLMAVVNAEYEFIFVDVGAEGRASDGGIWQRTGLNHMLSDPANPLNIPAPGQLPGVREDVPYFLIADDAFRMSPYLLKPYPGHHLTPKQRILNYRLCRARRIVENTFGILANRFRLLLRAIEVQGETQKLVVMACCILHNFLRKQACASYLSGRSVDQEQPDGTFVRGAWRADAPLVNLEQSKSRNPSLYAKKNRDNLADYFVTMDGEVPWQYERALGL